MMAKLHYVLMMLAVPSAPTTISPHPRKFLAPGDRAQGIHQGSYSGLGSAICRLKVLKYNIKKPQSESCTVLAQPRAEG